MSPNGRAFAAPHKGEAIGVFGGGPTGQRSTFDNGIHEACS